MYVYIYNSISLWSVYSKLKSRFNKLVSQIFEICGFNKQVYCRKNKSIKSISRHFILELYLWLVYMIAKSLKDEAWQNKIAFYWWANSSPRHYILNAVPLNLSQQIFRTASYRMFIRPIHLTNKIENMASRKIYSTLAGSSDASKNKLEWCDLSKSATVTTATKTLWTTCSNID